MTRYFEDYTPGLVVDCGKVAVSEADIIAFAKEYDPQPFHIDPSFDSPYGGLIASGWHTISLVMRQLVDHFVSGESSLGAAGVDEVRWPRPVRPGDTLGIRATVLEARRSRSKPDRGIIRSLIEASNGAGEPVLRMTAINFVLARDTPLQWAVAPARYPHPRRWNRMLRSLLCCGAVVGCALAVFPDPAALAVTTGHSKVVITTPSARVGGLPASSLDGKVEYIPKGDVSRAEMRAPSEAGPATGYDVSWPQCGGAMPPSSSIGIVGVDDGHPFSQNPCLEQEAQWASTASQRAQYMVLDSPVGWSSPHVLEYAYHGPAGDCTATEYACQSYNWGYNAAVADVQYATSQGATNRQWWLDVELPTSTSIDPSGADCYQPNFWVCDPGLNSLVVLGAVVALREQGEQVGVYSTKTQWQAITGGLRLGAPIWIAGFDYAPATYCDPANASTYWFGHGVPRLVQSLPATYDPDTDCWR